MKLISRKYGNRYAGQTIHLPVVGDVQFSDDGTLEVPDEKAEDVIIATVDSFDFDSEKSQKQKKEEDPEITEWKKKLDQASTKELLELALEAKLGKPDDLAAWTDGKLKKELLKKLTAPAK